MFDCLHLLSFCPKNLYSLSIHDRKNKLNRDMSEVLFCVLFYFSFFSKSSDGRCCQTKIVGGESILLWQGGTKCVEIVETDALIGGMIPSPYFVLRKGNKLQNVEKVSNDKAWCISSIRILLIALGLFGWKYKHERRMRPILKQYTIINLLNIS